jgi:L-lactate dehydrogenase (cytochrome)
MEAAAVGDFRALAEKRLPPLLFHYMDGGSYAEETLRRNVEDMRAVALRQRVMVDVSNISMSTSWLGQDLSMPVGLGPIGFAGMLRRRGECQAARAAAKAGVPFTLSTVSICGVNEVAAASPGPIWYQLYMVKDRGYMDAVFARVAALGCPVLVFTVDLPVLGARYRDYRTGMSAPRGLQGALMRALQGITHPAWVWDVHVSGRPHTFGNLVDVVKNAKGVGDFAGWVAANVEPALTWKDLDWIRARWKGPIVLKGILDADDARRAVEQGIDGIVVSNHGGRQLDGALSGVKALPAVADAVDKRALVLMDGGVRSGLDVLRALALGADGCLLGRAWAYALAAQGEAGVSRMLAVIRAELGAAMALTGCTEVRKAGRELLA